MDNAFADKTETALIAERSAVLAAPAVDENALHALEDEAARCLNAYLAGGADVDVDESPLFYGFIKVFGETENADLRVLAKKAEAKITPVLKQFDHMAGYDNLAKISPEEIERNITDLDGFERIDPFKRDADGKFAFEQFAPVFKVLSNVEIVDDDDGAVSELNETFMETVLETARMKTYMRLCVSDREITQQDYLSELQFEMEKAVVVLFVMDKTSGVEFPMDAAQVGKIHQEFQKLIDVLDE